MRILIKPLSVNEAWQGKRFKTKKYKSFEKELLLQLPSIKIDFKKQLKITVTFGFSNSLSDIDNPLKPTIDCLQKKYGFNDRNIYELNVKKEVVSKGEDFISFQITEL
jgi:Holliday junction resolvase RusA-like endonuclease